MVEGGASEAGWDFPLHPALFNGACWDFQGEEDSSPACLKEERRQPSEPGINEPWTSPKETGAGEEGTRFLEEGSGQNSLSKRLGSWNGQLGNEALIPL